MRTHSRFLRLCHKLNYFCELPRLRRRGMQAKGLLWITDEGADHQFEFRTIDRAGTPDWNDATENYRLRNDEPSLDSGR